LDNRHERPDPGAGAGKDAADQAGAAPPRDSDPASLERRVAEVREFFRLTAQEWAKRNPQAVEDLGDPGGAFRQAKRQCQDEVRRLAAELVASGEGKALASLIRDAPMEVLVPVCDALTKLRHAAALPWVLREFRGSAPEARQAILRLIAAVGGAEGYQVVSQGLTDQHEAVQREAEKAREALLARDEALRVALALASGERPGALLGESVREGLARRLALCLSTHVSLEEGLAALEALRSAGGRGRSGSTWGAAVRRELLEFVRPQAAEEAGAVRAAPKPGSQRALLLLAAESKDLPDWALSQTAQAVIVRASAEDRSMVLRKASPEAATRLLREALRSKARQSINRGLSHLGQDRPDIVPAVAEELKDLAFGTDLEHSLQAGTLLILTQPEGNLGPTLSRRLALILMLAADESGAKPYETPAVEALLMSPAGRRELARVCLMPAGEGDGSPIVGRCIAVLQARGKKTERMAFLDELLETLADGPVGLPVEGQAWILKQVENLGQPAFAQHSGRLALGLARLCAQPPDSGTANAKSGTESVVLALLAQSLRDSDTLRVNIGPALLEELAGARTREIEALLNALPQTPPSILPLIQGALHRATSLKKLLVEVVGAMYASHPEAVRTWLEHTGLGRTLQPLLRACAELERGETLRAADRYRIEDKAERDSLNDSINDLLDRLEDTARSEPSAEAAPPGDESAVVQAYVAELGEALFAVLNSPPRNLPEPPPTASDPLADYHQVRLTRLAMMNLIQQRSPTLRSNLAAQAALPIEKLLLTLRGSPRREAVASVLAAWFSDLGVSLLEPELGSTVPFRSGKHVARDQVAPGEPVEVLSWGFAAPDGSVVRKALVAGAE